ncbi:MAG: hypothetical protein JSR47_04490 [Proteobacteria bacterium]|nr:hypothetical protein [Pseudomonadota bacterium]
MRLSDRRILWPAIGVVGVIAGTLIADHWGSDTSVARSDYVGTIDVSAEDAKLYREVPFEWRIQSPAGSFSGRDTARVRIDVSGESVLVCGWLRLDKAGASIRATRWLSEARLKIGDARVAALFISPADKAPGDGLNAGCARLIEPKAKPAIDAPLALEGSPVHE